VDFPRAASHGRPNGISIDLFANIHGNLEALEPCLTHAARQGVELMVFLGDLLSYGNAQS